LIKAFAGIVNPKKWRVFVEAYETTKFDHAFDVSWSQGGEDKGLTLAFQGLGQGTYVDVGAHHPSRFSVTRKLVNLGWSGVNIEANPALIEAFEKARPNDINLWACVGTEAEYKLTVFTEPAISTVNSDWRLKFLEENQEIASEITVPGVSLKEIFSDYFNGSYPDLLCIDAEGSDLEVLESAELEKGVGPEWLLLESFPPLREVIKTPAVELALKLGYEIHLIMGMSTLLRKTS
jgi:FkbM family methyltransferase